MWVNTSSFYGKPDVINQNAREYLPKYFKSHKVEDLKWTQGFLTPRMKKMEHKNKWVNQYILTVFSTVAKSGEMKSKNIACRKMFLVNFV
jgi:thiamine kinase-like enzyme